MGRKSKEVLEVEQGQLYASTQKDYKKSNVLINAKSRNSLLGQKLFAISILSVEENEDGKLISRTYTPKLKKLLGTKSGSMYTHIQELVNPKLGGTFTDWKLVYDDPKTKELNVINVIEAAKFANGTFEVLYTDKAREYITGLSKNFTMLNINEQFSLTSQYSFRMYEILKQQMDRTRAVTKSQQIVEWVVNLTELKLKLGIIDANSRPDITKALTQSEKPDYDKIEELAGNDSTAKKYQKYGSFKSRVLEKAVNELNEKTSLSVSYEEQKSGRGGKVREIAFHIDYKDVTPKEEIVENKPLSEEDTDRILDEISDLTGGKLRISECRAVAKAADYDMEKIRKAVFLSKKQTGHINNLTGWLISAINGEYKDSAMGFINFEQRKDGMVIDGRQISFEDLLDN